MDRRQFLCSAPSVAATVSRLFGADPRYRIGYTTNTRGGTLRLCCLSKKLKHIFAITRLEDVFAIDASEADAVAAAAK